ncbi:tyrosine-type recombinase/integrase [Pigmentiphaga litoralis]
MFATWAGFLFDKRMTVLEATSTEASEFFGDKALVPVSRRRYLQLLDKVYQHLISVGWALEHPLQGLLRLERELAIALPVGLDTDQLGKLEQVLAVMKGTKAPRDRSLAALMVGGGLRSNEVIRLRCTELQPNFGIEVKSHTVHPEHSTLVLPDGPWRMWLEQWLQERRARNVPGELLCPAAANGKAFTTSGLYRRIDHWFSLAGIEPAQGGANVLRNTFARLALESNRYTVVQVQGFMGHAEIRTTERHLAQAPAAVGEDVAY